MLTFNLIEVTNTLVLTTTNGIAVLDEALVPMYRKMKYPSQMHDSVV